MESKLAESILQLVLSPLLSSLIGGVIVFYFGVRTQKGERRATFREKQLSEFYSIIAGYRQRIYAKWAVQYKVSDHAGGAWKEICDRYSGNPEQFEKVHSELTASFDEIIKYDNRQLVEETMPLFRKMLDHFTEKYWLADADTRTHYQNFVEYVELWERYLVKSLPFEVMLRLDKDKVNLNPFFIHIDKRLEELQAELKCEKATQKKQLTL